MAQKYRKAMVDRERLKTLAFGQELARRSELRRHDLIYYLVALLWAAAAALPSFYIGRPIPFMVGSTVPNDIHSRVDFRWRDPVAESQAVRNLESSYRRRYREEPLAAWAAETHGPIDEFLNRTAASDNLADVEQAAKELNIPASDEQLGALWRGAAFARNDPYHYLVSPLREILDNEIHPRGVLETDRFEIERGGNIQIMHDNSSSNVLVGGEKGPLTPAQLTPILDARFRVKLSPWIPEDFKTALRDVVVKRMRPSLIYDEAVSRAGFEEQREELLSRVQAVQKNAVIVSRGSVVSLDKLAMLREEERVFRESQGQSWQLSLSRFFGNFLLFAAISLAMVIYFKAAEGRRPGALRRYLATGGLCMLPVLAGYVLIAAGLPGTMLPIGLVVGIAALGMNSWTSIFIAAISTLGCLILFEGRPDLMIGHLAGSMFFLNSAPRCRWRITLLIASVFSGLIGAGSFIAWNLSRGDLQNLVHSITTWSQAGEDIRGPIIAALGLLGNWLVCGVLVLALITPVERYFGVTTRIHLQDLASQEHPLLRRLIIEAPGTYHHSSVVSTLAETAAAAIGADGLKARIGGQFHDIGKLLKPEYFTENEFGISRHEKMNPNMSALLIINHVRDGVEMARSLGLPNIVTDMILQHHGDALMKFFYHKAARQAPPGAVIAREPFLYPGPKPQTPEAGVLMIADSVEAAVRSLDDPSPQHLRELLARLIRDRLIDGQFEDSGLTMRQLSQIEDVLFRMLVSMYHTRVKYPGQEKEKQGRKR